jgi:predicted transcriptional regulator/predicted RNase H-like nuclease
MVFRKNICWKPSALLSFPLQATIDGMSWHVLGVDTAWTPGEPSGVVLLNYEKGSKPVIGRAGRSYREFCTVGGPSWDDSVTGSQPELHEILRACAVDVDVVSLDIPLSPIEITGRRCADNAISKEYGSRGAGTHTPSSERPGPISASIFTQLTASGFRWTGQDRSVENHVFIEVYPHTAIIELFGYDYRFPYKVQKRGRYWPDLSTAERKHRVIENLVELRGRLTEEISNVPDFLPLLDPRKPYRDKFLKGYEDLLDALVCGLVGHFYLKGETVAFGDGADGVIWVPKRGQMAEPVKKELISFDVPVELIARLDVLADTTGRPRSFHAIRAIDEYLTTQEWQVTATKKGIAEADAGRVVPHEKAIEELYP